MNMKPAIILLLLAFAIPVQAEYGSNLGRFGRPGQPGIVHGSVYDGAGQPVNAATILGPWGLQTNSAADGKYQLAIDIPGQYTISISTGVTEVQQVVEISPGVQVTFNVGSVPVPSLGFSPANLAFQAEVGKMSPAQLLTVSNNGSGSLNYTLSSTASWIQINPTSGSGGNHNISGSCAALTAGLRAGVVTISDAGADNSPMYVPASLNCTQPSTGDNPGDGDPVDTVEPPSGDKDVTGGTTEPTTDTPVTTDEDTGEGDTDDSAVKDTAGCGCTLAGGSTLPEIWLFVMMIALATGRQRRRLS